MRILHLFANYKWTGPADPAIRCAAHLRRLGADVVFAQAGWTLPEAEHRMAKELSRARMPVVAGLMLRKHFHVPSMLHDAKALRSWLDAGRFDVVHTHLLADHLIAAVAKRRARHRPVLVRSFYEPTAPARRSWRDRVALRYTEGVVAPTQSCAADLQRRFGIHADNVLVQDPPIERADHPVDARLRARWGLSDQTFVIGITARIQPHRRFELLWQVMRQVVDVRPDVRLVLLGRGNDEDTRRLVHEPIERLGLRDHVILPGYLHEPDYGFALGSLDAFVFLVPGSDGTCRAVREAFAIGLPVVTTKRGILEHLCGPVDSGGPPCGVNVEETPAAMATALIELCDSPARRRELGAAAQSRATTSMDPELAAKRLLDFYAALAEGESS